MQTTIWAFWSGLVLMLIISFLPLGFTLKGKFFVVLAGFVLALGGLAATTSFPLWVIVLMLFVLAFFAAYMIDSRMGAMVYEEQAVVEELIHGDNEIPLVTEQRINDTFETSELEVMGLHLEKSEVDLNLLASLSSKEEKVNGLGLDEDISFLQEHNIEIEVESVSVDSKMEVSFLSEIESMLLEAEKDWLDEFAVTKEKIGTEKIDVEDNQIDESELEMLFGFNEAAAGHEDNLRANKSKVIVDLQK